MEIRTPDHLILKAVPLISWITLTILIVEFGQASGVTIQDNGYSGIVVALAPHITQTEGEGVLPKIKELFTRASTALYTATRQRAYFHNVTILVPQTWERREEYQTAGRENFGTADVRIDDPNPTYGDGPYTLQPLGCGSPGLYIHLTLPYLRNLDGTSTDYFGDPGKTLVHEWAHLRYGIFDEFGYPGDPMFPMFYYDDEELIPNSCTNGEAIGVYWDAVTGNGCVYDEEGLPNKDCVFKPDVNQNDAITSSLASYHFLKNVAAFCDDGETNYHNARSPNKHNVLCDGSSTWSVILQNEDFADGKNPARTELEEQYLTPTFSIVQETVATFALVLDKSDSMNDIVQGSKLPRSHILLATAQRWLNEEVPVGAAVGIVTFSTDAEYVHHFEIIKGEEERRKMTDHLPQKFIGATAIGKGLQLATKEMWKYREGPGGIIILLTDGKETASLKPLINKTIPLMVEHQVRLIAIALHTEGDITLEQAAKATGGKMYTIPASAGIEKLGMAFYEALTYQTSDFDLPQKIHTRDFTGIAPFFAGNFSIDATIGNDTIVDFMTDNSQDIINIVISGPDFKATLTAAAVDQSLVRFKYATLKNGIYHYNITRSNTHPSMKVQVSVSSKAKSRAVKPIITQCWIQETPTSTKEKPRFVLLATVRQGDRPVINAAVVAKVDRPDVSSVILQLFDNGDGSPDVTRNDGIYSRYFTKLSGQGRYSVTAQVTDDGNAAIREVGFTGSSSMPAMHNFQTNQKIIDKETGAFERHVSGGSFHVELELHEDTTDLYPPSRVSDLRVTYFRDNDSLVMFNWTAPGDDGVQGNAASYDLRYSADFNQLFSNFSTCESINVESIPLPSGSEESLITFLPVVSSKTTIYVALRAVDKAGQMSKLSNVVDVIGRVNESLVVISSSTNHPAEPFTPVSGTTSGITIDNTLSQTTVTSRAEENKTIIIVVGAVLTAFVIVMLIIGCIMYGKGKAKKLVIQ